MSYSIAYAPKAEQDLAAIWLAASDRNSITAAAHAADKALQRDPYGESESRPNGRRLRFEKPLGIVYRVLERERRVRVIQIYRFKTRS